MANEPISARELRLVLHRFDRILALVLWWSGNRDAFRSAWSEAAGARMTDGTFPEDSAKGRIARLEEALSKAAPLDELRHSLKEAA